MDSKITSFIVSFSDNPNFKLCMNAVKNQTLKTKVEVIKNYAPMSRAFQEMLNRVNTPYFVEIDEDMILNPSAIQTMYDAIKSTSSKVAMVCHKLHDVHFDYNIFGIKIYKADIFKKYPYNLSTISCEMEQLERMKKDGYTIDMRNDIIGLHSPYWTNELIFERYFDLNEKYKLYKYQWIENLPYKLSQKLFEHPTKNNLYATMGAICSSFTTKVRDKEKNLVVKNKEFLKVKSLWSIPDRATLFMTNKCNFRCGFCFRNTNNKLEQFLDMNVNIVKTLLEKYPNIKGICCCGYGEPLMCNNLEEILQYLTSKKKVIGMITNGSLLKEKLGILRKNKPTYISVSLNAYNQDMHTIETGTHNQFNTIIEGIKLVKTSGIPIYLSSVCTKENVHHIPEIVKLANKLGVVGINLHNLLPHMLVNGKDNNEKRFLELVLTTKDKHIIDSFKQLPNAEIIRKYPTLIDIAHPTRKCQFPFVTLSVDGNGNISTCNSIYPPYKENGNINDDGVWRNDYCQRMRMLFGKEEIPLACKYCFRNYEKLTREDDE